MKTSLYRDTELREYRAANSLKLLYLRDTSNPIICLQLYIRSGSVQERQDEEGYAHFLEHLSFKATEKYPDNTLSKKASEIGAVLNAYTDFDSTCYYLIIPSEKLDTGMDILAQIAYRACFDSADVLMEKQIILEEIHQYEAEPEIDFIEYIQKNYFENSPLKRPVLGTPKSVEAATLSRLQAFYKRHYQAGNAFLVTTGDFDEAQIKLSFLSYFGEWEKRDIAPTQGKHLMPDKWRVFERNKTGMEMLGIALPELKESHPDSEALHIAIRYLAIGKSSVLHKILVERDKLCSAVKVSSLSGLLSGVSVILLYPSKKGQEARIIRSFFQAWADLLNKGIPAKDFELVKKDLIHYWLHSFDGVEQTANLIAAEEFNGDLSRISNYGAFIDSITRDEVLSVVRRLWRQDQMAFFYQGKAGLSRDQKELLQFYAKLDIPKENRIKPRPPKVIPARISSAPKSKLAASPQYHCYRLANNLKLVYNYLPGKELCGFALASGLSQLTDTKIGINYFATALMLYGTQYRSHEEIMQLSREYGFQIRVLHHLDSTIFRGKCDISDLPLVLSLLSEIILEPRFDRAYLTMLKNAAIDTIRRERDYPISVAYKAWFRMLFGKRNNLYSATGDISDIASISLDDCIKWLDTWDLGEDFAICIVGSMDPKQVYDLAEKYFGQTGGKKRIPPHNLEYVTKPSALRREYRKLDQSIIHIGGLGCPASEISNNTAFHLLEHILGGDLSSRMYDILRERYGFAYQTGFDFSSIRDLGFWCAYAFCDPKLYLKCLKMMQEIIADLSVSGISQQELYNAQNFLIAMSRFDDENLSFKAAAIANLISLGYDLDFYLNREQRINSIKIEQIDGIIERYLQPQNHISFVMV